MVLADPPGMVRIRMSDARGYTRVPGGVTVGVEVSAPVSGRCAPRARTAGGHRFEAGTVRLLRPPRWAMVYRTDAPRHDDTAAGWVQRAPTRSWRSTSWCTLRRVSLLHRRRPRTQRDGADRTPGPAQPLDQPGCLRDDGPLSRRRETQPAGATPRSSPTPSNSPTERGIGMRASPYDLTGMGYQPSRIETGGQDQYQRANTVRAVRFSAARRLLWRWTS